MTEEITNLFEDHLLLKLNASRRKHLYLPKSFISDFIDIVSKNIEVVESSNKRSISYIQKRSIMEVSIEIVNFFNPIIKNKENQKTIKKMKCVDIYPLINDSKKYKHIRELIRVYIKEFCVPGFLYYVMKKSILNDDYAMYLTLAKIADRHMNLRNRLETQQYELFKKYGWLLIFADIEDTVVIEEHFTMIYISLGNLLLRYNKIKSAIDTKSLDM